MHVFKLIVVTLLLSSLLHAGAEVKKPNILFLLADDQSWETVAAMSDSEVKTPNLDRLVDEGVSYQHAYNMGSWSPAVCVASRHMFMTGRSVWDAGRLYDQVREADESGRDPRPISWSQRLENAGYTTYFAGKWHVRMYEPEQIFNVVGTVRPGMPKQTPEGYNRPKDRNDTSWLPWDRSKGGFWEGGTHWSEVLRDETIEFIDQASRDAKPFFMYVAFNAPHDPRQAPKAYVDLYPPEAVKVPENFLPEYPYAEAMKSGRNLRDEKLAPFPRTEYSIQVNRAEYFALVTHMDAQIGAILDELKSTGQMDNTYIFYTADHGLAVGHHGLVGKQNMYEHSLGAPLIVNGPGLEKGKRVNQRVYIQDIVPSTLELAGLPPQDDVYFQSLMPSATGQAEGGYSRIYGAYLDAQRCVIEDGWKLIHYPKAGAYRLFNLEKDPLEMNDRVSDPEQAGRLQALKQSLIAAMQELNDPLVD